MPVKRKVKDDGETAVEREATQEATRLRTRAQPAILQTQPPTSSQPRIPAALRRSDGADIIKRNAHRKRKYLFIFPGGLTFPPSANIGTLRSLSTRTPTLDITVPAGVLRLFGTLVFPRNAFLSLKASPRAVHVLDVFETLVVFSEWRWLGDITSNPGLLPATLPDSLMRGTPAWRAHFHTPSDNSTSANQVSHSRAHSLSLSHSLSIPSPSIPSSTGNRANRSPNTDSPDTPDAPDPTDPTDPADEVIAVRSNPRRSARTVNYSQLLDSDGSSEAADGDNQDDTGSAVKRRHGKVPSQSSNGSVHLADNGSPPKPTSTDREQDSPDDQDDGDFELGDADASDQEDFAV